MAAAGGTPSYEYRWSHAQTGRNAANLSPARYTATAVVTNGCSVSRDVTITVAGHFYE